MKRNRNFKPRKFRLSYLRKRFRDVTPAARDWNFPFVLHVQPALMQYSVPGISDDNEGSALVGSLVQGIEAVLQGSGQSSAASHGKMVSMEFGILLEHRRKNSPEIVRVHVLFGPCDAVQTAFVSLAN